MVVRIATKFGIVTHFDPLKPAHDQNFDSLKMQDGGQLPFWKIEKSPYLSNAMNFCMMMHIDPLNCTHSVTNKICKNPRCRLPPFWTRRPASADRTARRQFQAAGQPVTRTQASDAMTSRLPRYEAWCVQRRCFHVPLRSDIKKTELPPANILIPLKRQLIALQVSWWQFLYDETMQQTFHPVLLKLSKRRQI